MGAELNQVIRYQPLSPLLVKSLIHGGLPPVSFAHSSLYIILEELNEAELNQVIQYQPLSSPFWLNRCYMEDYLLFL